MNEAQDRFTLLVKQHKSTIYTVCYMFSNNRDEVSDLFQEVLVRLWKGFASFGGRSDVRTWIYRVSLNTCISSDRNKRRMQPVSLDMNVDLYADDDADTRQIDLLHKRIGKLQPFDRAVVLLWLENMSYEEIAAIVGIGVKNVSVRLYRIKKQLKRMSND